MADGELDGMGSVDDGVMKNDVLGNDF